LTIDRMDPHGSADPPGVADGEGVGTGAVACAKAPAPEAPTAQAKDATAKRRAGMVMGNGVRHADKIIRSAATATGAAAVRYVRVYTRHSSTRRTILRSHGAGCALFRRVDSAFDRAVSGSSHSAINVCAANGRGGRHSRNSRSRRSPSLERSVKANRWAARPCRHGNGRGRRSTKSVRVRDRAHRGTLQKSDGLRRSAQNFQRP
jgi:hypothetical protein